MGNETSQPNDLSSDSEETEQTKKANKAVKKLQAGVKSGTLPAYLQAAKDAVEKKKK